MRIVVLVGAVLLFGRSGGNLLHAAVVAADDVVLTESGDHLQPWMFARVGDMTANYSFREPLNCGYHWKDFQVDGGHEPVPMSA